MLQELQQYLHEHIPLSKYMEVSVIDASNQGVTLSAPLAPNINHRATVFGGSASALAILTAWTLVYVKLKDENINSRVVIQRNAIQYQHSITGEFTAHASAPTSKEWEKFVNILKRKKRARITIAVSINCAGVKVGELEGDFVALGVDYASMEAW